MLLIKNISLENFMGIDNLDLEFESNQVTAITGIPGSGKSTLMFAIALAFSGYRKGETYKSYIKSGCSYAKVHMEGTLFNESIIYDITITGDDAKKCRAENIIANKSVLYKGQTYLNNDYNVFIKEHELDSLQNIMFMFQKESDISTVKPVERAEILKKVFGFDDIQECTDILKKEIEEYKENLIEYETVVNELKKNSYDEQPLIRTISNEKINILENDYDSLNEEFFKLNNIDESALQKENNIYNDNQRKLNDTLRNITNYENNVKNLNKDLIDVNDFLKNSKSTAELEYDIKQLDNDLNEHKKHYELISNNYNELNTTLRLYNHDLAEVNNQIKISETGVCHSCGQPVEHSHVERLEARRKEIETNISNTTVSIENLNFDPYDKVSASINSNIKSLNSTLTKVKNYELKKDSIKNNIENNQKWIDELYSNKNIYENNIKNSLARIEELKDIQEKISRKSELEAKMRSLKESINTYKANITKNNERLLYNEKVKKQKIEADERINEYNKKINEVNINIDDTKKAVEFIEKDLTNELIIRACRQLSDSINSIIKKVFPYMSVKLQGDKKGVNFFYNVDDSTDNWLSISMASGGQQQILGLAYKLAVAKEFGCTSIFLDEIDSSCSIEMAKTMYEFIFSLNEFNQVFLISHKPDVIDVAKNSDNDVYVYFVENGEYSLV